MDLLAVIKRFPDQETCIEHLEKIRWNGETKCPRCNSTHVGKRNETEIGQIGRWNCHDCTTTFKVTCGTLFHGTKIELQKWFMAIALILNAKKGLSSYQLSRDLFLNQKTAWRMETCIRAEMAKDNILLQGIIEADETYIGGKPRKENKKEDREPAKRGRGTDKDTILGAVERGGRVVAQLAKDLTGRTILDFIKKIVDVKNSELMIDEYRGYLAIGKEMKHQIIPN